MHLLRLNRLLPPCTYVVSSADICYYSTCGGPSMNRTYNSNRKQIALFQLSGRTRIRRGLFINLTHVSEALSDLLSPFTYKALPI